MKSRLTHATALGGYGTIITTIIIFFAQGGFVKMPPLSYLLYSVGLIIGLGLILYSVLKPVVIAQEAPTQKQDYAHQKIVEKKLPLMLEITNTLQEIANYQNSVLGRLLKRKMKLLTLAKIQKLLQSKLDVKPGNIMLGDNAKIEAITKQFKRLNLPSDKFNDAHVQILLAITWALDKYNFSLLPFLRTPEYKQLETKLDLQTSKISGKDTKELILTYLDLVLGLNSEILYLNAFPESQRGVPSSIDKTTNQLRYERDEMLKTLLQTISKEIERELK